MHHRSYIVLAAIVAGGMFCGAPVRSGTLHSRAEVPHLAFPTADRVELKRFALNAAEAATVEKLAKAHLPSRRITAYVGFRNGRALGYAFIDSSIVRTLPATFLVVVTPEGRVQNLETLAFYERDEYLPMKRWLEQFDSKALSPGLALSREIVGIAGATLTSQTVTAAVRRSLALYQVLFNRKE